MQKFAVAVLVLAGTAFAGTAFAIFQGQSLEGQITKSPALSRVTEIDPARAAPEGQKGYSRCSSPSGCGSSAGRGSCCSPSNGASTATLRAEQIRSYLADYYSRALGEGISVRVRDLGCHQEADILKSDKVIKRLSIRGGAVTEIT